VIVILPRVMKDLAFVVKRQRKGKKKEFGRRRARA
jgi:hypothetical protein